MEKIAFLGLGAMGQRMVARLLAAGHPVTVWNRTAASADQLCDAGARWAETPADAAAGADIVISMVRDDQASARVWLAERDGALAGMSDRATGVECSTVSLQHVSVLVSAFAEREIPLLDAPVAGSRPQAEAGQLIFMAGGCSSALAMTHGVLTAMGGKVLHAGENGAGMAAKLLVNGMFGVQLAALAELLAVLEIAGQDANTLLDVFAETPVASMAAIGAGRAMLAGQWQPSFPIDLVAKDFALILEGLPMAMNTSSPVGAAGDVFTDACAAGYGADNITGIIQRFRN